MTTHQPVTLEDVEEFAKTLDEYVKVKLKDKNYKFNALSESKSTIQFNVSQVESTYEINVFNKKNKFLWKEETKELLSLVTKRTSSLVNDPSYVSQLLLKISSSRDEDYIANELNFILASSNTNINEFERIKKWCGNYKPKSIPYDDTSSNSIPSLMLHRGKNDVSIKLLNNSYYVSYESIGGGRTESSELSTKSTMDPIELIKETVMTQ